MAKSVNSSLLSAVVVALGLVGSGCAQRSQVVVPAPSVLNVPPAPPRVISVPPEPVAPVETATAEPSPDSPPVRTTRPAARPDAAARTGPVSDSELPVPAEAPVERVVEPAPTAPLLRTPQTRDESQADRRIRLVLERAKETLDQVNASSLSREARSQHDTARRFIEQSEQALLERNFVFASYLADKAETLARGLSR